ncbi:hypothetical protein DPEC_G00099530 [Dallia pectoralis]|uniref:Uncharacterized protein n=1 Tax=Dallia pectoralis TaxID=75939 RepID=A0ACC2GWB8_DALPE|nr:hypothetical protein DPEC_G00099530 [Dallia pectoralis]
MVFNSKRSASGAVPSQPAGPYSRSSAAAPVQQNSPLQCTLQRLWKPFVSADPLANPPPWLTLGPGTPGPRKLGALKKQREKGWMGAGGGGGTVEVDGFRRIPTEQKVNDGSFVGIPQRGKNLHGR